MRTLFVYYYSEFFSVLFQLALVSYWALVPLFLGKRPVEFSKRQNTLDHCTWQVTFGGQSGIELRAYQIIGEYPVKRSLQFGGSTCWRTACLRKEACRRSLRS